MGDFETFIFILILFVVVVITLPLVILSKIGQLNQQIKGLDKKINSILDSGKKSILALSDEVKKEEHVILTPPPVPYSRIMKETYKEENTSLYQRKDSHAFDTGESSFTVAENKETKADDMEDKKTPAYSVPPVPDSLKSPKHETTDPLHTVAESKIQESSVQEKEEKQSNIEEVDHTSERWSADKGIMDNANIPVYSMPTVPDSLESPVHEPVKPLQTSSKSNIPPPPSVSEKDDSQNFLERILGANWLSKIGIVTLVLGVAFFVKYAIDQNWINEVGRVGIGLLTGAIIIGIAHLLKAKYHVFSSILVGGGISVFYITITLAFREYELFSQTIAFGLLIFITIFSVLLSLVYDRKELAIFSLLGGFASPLMVSTGAGNYIVLFSYILILNTGMLIVSFVKQWRIIGVISYGMTLVFFWSWTLISFKDEFFNIAIFISLFFIQFYLLALFDHFKSGKTITPYQVFLILSNNLLTYLAYLYVFDKYSSDIRGIITISLAAANAVVLVTLFRNSKIDRNLVYLLIAIVMSLVSLAVPVQLKGHVITLFWAAESVVLLWLWQKSQIKVFHVGFILISIFTLFSYLIDINNNYSYYDSFEILVNRLFITGFSVVGSYVINLFLLKRDKEHLNENLQTIWLFKFLIIILSYVVLFIELNFQLKAYTDITIYDISSFRNVALATFTTIYMAVLACIYRKQISSGSFLFGLLYVSVFLYTVIYSYFIIELRADIFHSFHDISYTPGLFHIHLLSLPAIGYIIYLLVRNMKSFSQNSTILSWILTVLVVAILSIETDNLIIGLWGNDANYKDLLYNIHTFGYPILWGMIAMILMIWGLNRKEVLLRKISLVFFVLIIIKFYAYDVWMMSQAGRIISFVILGIILLVVSFLLQKIRTLVKEPEKTDDKIS